LADLLGEWLDERVDPRMHSRRVARGLIDGSLPPDLAREEQDRIRMELDVAQLNYCLS